MDRFFPPILLDRDYRRNTQTFCEIGRGLGEVVAAAVQERFLLALLPSSEQAGPPSKDRPQRLHARKTDADAPTHNSYLQSWPRRSLLLLLFVFQTGRVELLSLVLLAIARISRLTPPALPLLEVFVFRTRGGFGSGDGATGSFACLFLLAIGGVPRSAPPVLPLLEVGRGRFGNEGRCLSEDGDLAFPRGGGEEELAVWT